MSLGSILRNKRTALSMNQSNVAAVMGWISHQAVSNWENGLTFPTDAHIKQLAQILDLDASLLRQLAADEAAAIPGRSTSGTCRESAERSASQSVRDTRIEDNMANIVREKIKRWFL